MKEIIAWTIVSNYFHPLCVLMWSMYCSRHCHVSKQKPKYILTMDWVDVGILGFIHFSCKSKNSILHKSFYQRWQTFYLVCVKVLRWYELHERLKIPKSLFEALWMWDNGLILFSSQPLVMRKRKNHQLVHSWGIPAGQGKISTEHEIYKLIDELWFKCISYCTCSCFGYETFVLTHRKHDKTPVYLASGEILLKYCFNERERALIYVLSLKLYTLSLHISWYKGTKAE